MKHILLLLAALLLLCLAPLPYGFYQLVRFVMMVAFAMMAYKYYEEKQSAWAVTFGSLALLFQPLLKVSLGRTIWNIVDVAVAILLIIVWMKRK